jgi:CBS domain-containing protein
MSIGRICLREVYLAEVDESVAVVAARMAQRNVGTLVVLDADKRPQGIVTDRDLVMRVLAPARDPRAMRVCEVMSPAPHVITEDAPIEEALTRMRAGGFRRLPVIDAADRLVGIVSLDDVLGLLAEEMVHVGALLARETPRPAR